MYEISGRKYGMLYLMNKSIGEDKFYNVEGMIMIVDVKRIDIKEKMA